MSATRLALAGMLSLAVGMGIGRFAFTPVLPMMQADIGLSLSLAGWLAAANYLGYLAGAVAAVRVRAGAGAMVRGALLGTALTTAAMGFADSPVLWLVLRFLAGVVSAWTLIFAAAWVLPALSARGASHLSGLHFSGVGLGTAVTGVVCLALGAWQVSSEVAWWVLGGLGLAFALMAWPAFASEFGVSADGPGGVSSLAERSVSGRGHWALILAYGCFGFGYIIPATFLPAMARDLVADPGVFGWAWPAFGAAAFLSTLGAGAIRQRVGNRVLWIACQVVMAAAVALPALWDGIVPVMLSALGVGGTFMVVTQAALEEARGMAPATAARLMALMTAAFATGQVLGPVAVSLVVHLGHPVTMLLLAAAVVLMVTAVPLCSLRRSG